MQPSHFIACEVHLGKNAALSQVIGDQAGISGIGADELSDDDFDKLGLSEGRVIEAATIG